METRSFYTVGQLAEFMDVEVSKEHVILVNNREANFDTLIYENFTIEWTVISYKSSAYMPQSLTEEGESAGNGENFSETAAGGGEGSFAETGAAGDEEDFETGAAGKDGGFSETVQAESSVETWTAGKESSFAETGADGNQSEYSDRAIFSDSREAVSGNFSEGKTGSGDFRGTTAGVQQEKLTGTGTAAYSQGLAETGTAAQSQLPAGSEVGKISRDVAEEMKQAPGTIGILVYINGQPVRLTGKQRYVFVDIFDFYDFDLKEARGRNIITNLNGQNAQYSAELQAGDEIELGWKEK